MKLKKDTFTLLQLKKTAKSISTESGWALPGDKWEVVLTSKLWDSIYHEKAQRQHGLGFHEGNPVDRDDLKIIKTLDIPESIEYQVARFNEDIEAGNARFSPVYHTNNLGPDWNTTIVVGGKPYQVETIAERDRLEDDRSHFVIGINGIHYIYPVVGNAGAFNEDGYVTRYAREALARMEIRKAYKLVGKSAAGLGK